MKYDLLTDILDGIRKEAPTEYVRYHDISTDDKLTKARCRAYIHLLLKIKFKISNFIERESLITDEGQDGGLDAYFIDNENKDIYLIQSKFRSTEKNFEAKDIDLHELIKMEYDKIIQGQRTASNGIEFNSKILNFQNKLSRIENIGEYTYRIIILANLKKYNEYQIQKILGDYEYEIYDYSKTYEKLIYPICTSNNYENVKMNINLNQDKLSILKEEFKVEIGKCKANVVFLPVIEIAKVMNRYKNSILEYNPRNYLSISESKVNGKIKKSLTDNASQEFAILNNGITILCDSFNYTDKTGQRNKINIIVNNPQIINGAQTSYTLNKIYNKRENLEILNDKKVMVRFIEIIKDDGIDDKAYTNFVYKISDATNTQNTVSKADRTSNKKGQIEFQKYVYNNYGYLYERKRGEYDPILSDKNIEIKELKSLIIKKSEIIRSMLAYMGKVRFAKNNNGDNLLDDNVSLEMFEKEDLYCSMFLSFLLMKKLESKNEECKNYSIEEKKYKYGVSYGKYAMIYAASIIKQKSYNDFIAKSFEQIDELSNKLIEELLNIWSEFEENLTGIDIKDRKKMYDYYKTAKPEVDIKEFLLKN